MLYVFYYNKNKTPINAVEDAFSQTCVVSIFFFLTCHTYHVVRRDI